MSRSVRLFSTLLFRLSASTFAGSSCSTSWSSLQRQRVFLRLDAAVRRVQQLSDRLLPRMASSILRAQLADRRVQMSFTFQFADNFRRVLAIPAFQRLHARAAASDASAPR